MKKTLLEYDDFTGLTEIFHPARDGKWGIETIQDVEPVLEANKALQNDGDGYSESRELRRAASIPHIVQMQWLNKLGVDLYNPNHWPAVKRLLNDPEWRHLRTAPGNL